MNDEIDRLVTAHKEDVHRAPAHLVLQWHAAIDEAAALERGRDEGRRQTWHPGSFFWGAAVTAALAIGIGIGFSVSGGKAPVSAPPAPLVTNTRTQTAPIPAAFSRGLQVHLRDSREAIATLPDTTDSKMLVMQIIDQNRMFEIAADRNDAPQLARVLRAFEPILLELAASDIAPEDADALRAQLAFELNVMLTKLANQPSDESHTT